jgi:hypothetical protein
VGEAYVDRVLVNGSIELSKPGQELVTEWCWGYAWTRPGLDWKQRSLLDIGARPSWPPTSGGATNKGLTELETREAILHYKYASLPRHVTLIPFPNTVDRHQMADIVDRHNPLRCTF